jgi:hypothetical protein
MKQTIPETVTAQLAPEDMTPLAVVSGADLLTREQQLPSGHRVLVDAANGSIRITNAQGLLELSVRCSAQGCHVQLGAGDLQLASPGRIAIDCAALDIQARQRISLRSDGELLAAAAGQAGVTADQLHLRATCGDAILEANDHVRLVGEQIRLNSEQNTTLPNDELRALWKRLGIE